MTPRPSLHPGAWGRLPFPPALVIALLLFAPGDGVMAQDRDDPYATMFRVLEAAVEAAYPGATVERTPPTVLHPDGTSDRVEVGCYQEEAREDRGIVILSFSFPERTRAAVDRSASVGEAMAGGRSARLGIVTMDDDGTPAEARVAFLEPGGHPATCQRLSPPEIPALSLYSTFLERVGALEGPLVDVEITTLHEFRGGLASIVWGGAFDVGQTRHRLLVPAAVSLDTGTTEIFLLQDPDEAGVLVLQGRTTGKTFRYRCPEPDTCLIPPQEIMAWVAEL